MFKIVLYSALIWHLIAMPAMAAECTTAIPEAKTLKGKLQLTELLPNPSGNESTDEFIELYNGTDQPIQLDEFKLQDASNKPISLSGSVGAKRYVVFYRSETKISLNNSGDTVTLLHPNGTIIDTVTYTETAEADMGFSRVDGSWTWTTPSAGKVNTVPEPSPSDDAGATVTSTEHPIQLSDDVSLSELLPDPEGNDATDEWIELYNAGEAIDLYGWKLQDSSRTYTITESTLLSAGGYLQFQVTQTGLSLNNSGETITLLNPNDTEVDSVTYPTSISGQSYSFINGAWQWTTPTPNAANALANEEPGEVPTSGTTIASIKALASGTAVTVTGVVTALPGVYSVNYFYMQDATSGIQVYSSTKNFPTLSIGDAVQVVGTISSTNGEPKLSVQTVTVNATAQTITSKPVTSLAAADAGLLVALSGKITAKASSTITLDSGLVYVKRGTGISTSGLSEGQVITVTGVLTSTNDGVQLWPRQQSDIATAVTAAALINPLIPSAQAAEASSITVAAAETTNTQTQDLRLLWLGLAAGAALLVMRLARWPWLNTVVRNWVDSTVRAWVNRWYQRVG